MSSFRITGFTGTIMAAALFTAIVDKPLEATTPYIPQYNPSLKITRAPGAVKIDGILDDAAWANAGRADNFVERSPGENLPPDVATEAFVTYDSDNLYVGFRCFDNPATIRATMCQRDQFENDDAVVFLLDTYGNSSWAYEFFVNPYGVQKDRLWSHIFGEDEGFDLVWESAASIDNSGYQVEIAIPFTSLRFPNSDVQTWKVDFWRDHPRSSFKQYSWAAYDNNNQCWVCQWGTMNGLANVKPGKGLEILPSMIISQEGNMARPWNLDSPFAEGRGDANLSVGAKYSLSSTATLEGTYNPDFSQIETDAAQIDINSTIALRFPERRPFFQEGSDIFQTPFNSFYTRTVNDPQFAAKATVRDGRYSFGYLAAYDEISPYAVPLEEEGPPVVVGKSTVNVLRGTRAVGDDNQFGFIVTDRRFDGGGYGTVLSADGDYKLSRKYSIVGQYIYSFTEEPFDTANDGDLHDKMFDDGKYTALLDGETYSGHAFITELRRRARGWNFTIDYNQVAPTYRTQTGYDPWANYRSFFAMSRYNFYPPNGIFERITPNVFWENRWNFNNESKWYHGTAGVEGSLRFAQTYYELSFTGGQEKWSGVVFDKLWDISGEFNGTPLNDFGYEIGGSYGRGVAVDALQEGKEVFVYGGLVLKPIDRLIIEPSLNYARSRDPETDELLFEQTITRTRFRFQFNRELSLRLVAEYNNRYNLWNIDPLLTYKINPFSLFYAGSTHNLSKLSSNIDSRQGWKETSRQFFIKLQYLLRA